MDKHCICTRCGKEPEKGQGMVYSQGSLVCTECKKETIEDDKRAFDRDMDSRRFIK